MSELAKVFNSLSGWKSLPRRCDEWLSRWRAGRRCPKPLAISQSISLGDKRMLIVARYEQERFLIGITSNSMVLLTKLPAECGARELGIVA